MDTLLKNDFITFYGLPQSTISIKKDISHKYFEIEDVNRVVTISTLLGSGTAKYTNPKGLKVSIIDYDGFLTSLPPNFQHGKKRCDIISYTGDNSYFIINELKDANPKDAVLSKATLQMLSTLHVIVPVPTIKQFISKFTIKRCCYSNKKSTAPQIINATTAFNRLASISPPDGLKLSHPQIESYGFELFEYLGSQTIKLD